MASRIAMNFRGLFTVRPRSNWSSSRGVTTEAAAMKAKVGNNLDVLAYMPLGIVLTALTLAALTVKGQLAHSPSVRVNKKLRGTMPEVDEPDHVAGEGSRYVNRSFFRKVAHVQDFDAVRSGISDPTRPENAFQRPRHVESLKSVAVDR